MEYQPEECDPEHSPRRIVLIVAKILITFLPKQSHGIWTRSVRNFLKDFLDSLLSNAHTNWSNVLLPFSDIGSRTSTFDPCCRNVGLVAPSLIRSCVNLSVKHPEKSLKLQIGQCVWDTGIAGPRCTAGSAGAVSDVYQKISLSSEAVTNAPPARPVYYADFAFSDDPGLCDQVFPSRR